MNEENLILENTKLTAETFYLLFDAILLSEIIPYRHDQCNHLGKIQGISFFGNRISLEEFDKLNTIMKPNGLKLLISHNISTKRWRDFSFPKFLDKNLLLDIDKQCYSLILETNNKELLKYIYSYDEDREILNSTFENWMMKYNLDILWNDYFDIVLKFENAQDKKLEISRDIDKLLYYKISDKLTDQEKIEDRFINYPIVSLHLK